MGFVENALLILGGLGLLFLFVLGVDLGIRKTNEDAARRREQDREGRHV